MAWALAGCAHDDLPRRRGIDHDATGTVRIYRGTQYYDVSAGLDVGRGAWTVLVWCQTFGVPVAGSSPT